VILHVFDAAFTYRGRVENWISLTWLEQYRDEGKFTLIAYDTDAYAAILRHGWYFYRADRPVAMMAVKVERDTEKNTITVCGYSALHLLSRRIVGLPRAYTNVEAGIYDLIGTAEGMPGIACAKAKGLKAEYECEIEGVVLLDGVMSMLNESEYGIRANFDSVNKRHVMEVYEGADRAYNEKTGGTVFSRDFGSLRHLVVTEDDDLYKNVAYVTGAANNDPRTVYYQYVAPYAGEKENWRELLVKGENQKDGESNPDWRKRQKQIGMEALQKHRNALSFEVEISPGTFGKQYDLGDKVTCKDKRYGLMFNARVLEYKYTSKAGVEAVKITIGEKPLDYVKGAIVQNG